MNHELDILHPAIECWLRRFGLDYRHEVSLPIGRADFIIYGDNSKTHEPLDIIIEAKWNIDSLEQAYWQALIYKVQQEELTGHQVQIWLAYPAFKWWATVTALQLQLRSRAALVPIVCEDPSAPVSLHLVAEFPLIPEFAG